MNLLVINYLIKTILVISGCFELMSVLAGGGNIGTEII